jgi:hypothetical protein
LIATTRIYIICGHWNHCTFMASKRIFFVRNISSLTKFLCLWFATECFINIIKHVSFIELKKLCSRGEGKTKEYFKIQMVFIVFSLKAIFHPESLPFFFQKYYQSNISFYLYKNQLHAYAQLPPALMFLECGENCFNNSDTSIHTHIYILFSLLALVVNNEFSSFFLSF